MDDALLVGGCKAFGELHGQRDGFVDGDGPSGEALAEILAFNKLHHQERLLSSSSKP